MKLKAKMIYETDWEGLVSLEPREGVREGVKANLRFEAWRIESKSIVLLEWDGLFQHVRFDDKDRIQPLLLSFSQVCGIVAEAYDRAFVRAYAEKVDCLGDAVDLAVERAGAWRKVMSNMLHDKQMHEDLEAYCQRSKK